MAKRRPIYTTAKEDIALSDPLSDYTGDFDIVRFLDENSTPVESPSDPTRYLQGHQNATAAVSEAANKMMYQNPSRDWPTETRANIRRLPLEVADFYCKKLPDSPPITDISGAGSSGSPSSTSDSPYSPDTYHTNYQVVQGQQNGNGLILGVRPDLTAHMLVPQELLQQSHIGSRILQHATLPSPQADFINNGGYSQQTTPSTLPQISPPTVNMRQVNSAYLIQQNNSYQIDPYNNVISSAASDAENASQSDGPVSRKRLRNDSHHPPTPTVKNEPQKVFTLPSQLSVVPSPVAAIEDFDDNFHQQAIKFTRFNEDQWAPLYDINQRPLHQLEMHVVADKGFNYSTMDGCFVNQKKNHFQISVHIEAIDSHPPNYAKIGNELKMIKEFKLAFCGVKSEMPASEIQIKQSTTDRRPVPHDPVSLEIHERRMTKVTVPRLHFSETTMNNQRKNGRPNPDQKYFLLVVRLIACTADGHDAVVQAYQSEKVIVRASNPGQFEPPDSDATWQKNGSTLFYNSGSVAIGTDRAVAPLTVGGDIYCSGVLHRPSDRRIKEQIHEVDTKTALSHLAQIRVVGYSYKPDIALQWGLSEENRHRVGVIAQELAEILPDAVTDNGDFLQVDDSRIFYETVAAATELCRLTGNLEHKIEAVEKLSHKLARLHRRKGKDIGSLASDLSDLAFSDKTSFMSSHSSLVSNTPSCITRDTNHRHKDERRGSREKHWHCRNPACHRAEPPLCSSKVTQGTIVALVAVMAVCLIAMSTLYVLDWHNRTFGHGKRPYQLDLSTVNAPIGEQGSVLGGKQEIGHIVQVQSRVWIPPLQLNVPPLQTACIQSYCRTFCCIGSSGKSTQDENEKKEREIKRTKFDAKRKISARSPFASGINIEILDFNVTLDERYCIEDSCKPKRGLYTLYVPISPSMPTVPLEIKIDAGNGGAYVDSCGSMLDFVHKACDDDYATRTSRPTVQKLTEGVYELSVGHYMQSSYRFRIGYSTESCNMDESQRGRSFDEYNLVFYRRCHIATS